MNISVFLSILPSRYTNLSDMTTLYVYFKDLTCIRYRRDLYMTWDALFASFGGIFSLCLGGSILSLVEMAYFFTIRLIVTLKRRISESKSERKAPGIEVKKFPTNVPTPVLNPIFRTAWATRRQ